MTELQLAKDFGPVTREAWLALVAKALKGGDFERKLVGRTYDGIRLEPLYTPSMAPSAAPDVARGASRQQPGDQQTLAWEIRQPHAGTDPAAVNAAILEDLAGGASGIALQLAAPGQYGLPADTRSLERALADVRLDWIALSLAPGHGFAEAGALVLDRLAKLTPAPEQVHLGLGVDPLGTLARTGGLASDWDSQAAALAGLYMRTANLPLTKAGLVDGRPYHDAGASEAQELAAMAATLVAYLRALEAHGVDPAPALRRTAFVLSADAQIFATIAKLRAARRLIARIAEVAGASAAAPSIQIAAETSARMLSRRDAHTNMLRTTVACAAAAMGGADAITVLPFTWALGQPDAFARRMARNTQIVLMEESSLGRVLDPAGGSWYVETLTAELAAKAWGLFQEIEARGGMLAALQAGHVQAMIAKTATERAKNMATGREELIGLANFPDLKEASFEVAPHPPVDDLDDPAITAEPLTPRRPAAPLESLRDASDAYLARTGQRPRIFLANLGTTPEFNARASFAANFFAAGGIETLSNDGFTASADTGKAFAESGATVACLCSSDANYALLAEATAMALKGAGAAHIYLAGRPGDRLESWRAAGIGSYIFMGSDAPDVLAKAHAILGVRA